LRGTGYGHDGFVVADASGTLSSPGRKFKPEGSAKGTIEDASDLSGKVLIKALIKASRT